MKNMNNRLLDRSEVLGFEGLNEGQLLLCLVHKPTAKQDKKLKQMENKIIHDKAGEVVYGLNVQASGLPNTDPQNQISFYTQE